MQLEPIFLKPVLQEKIWGGNNLQTHYQLPIPSEKTGEAWMISAHSNGVSTIISPEKYAGQPFDTFYSEHPELFGKNPTEVFPLLVKILDATDDLSVQVHPDDEYSLEHEGELGKTECWYVIDNDSDAEIILGHSANSKEDFKDAVDAKDWDKLFTHVKVQPGDFYDVPAGTIHAIGAGNLILEVQQSSDVTYRVYDYDRKDDDGHLRDLHIEETIAVTTYPHVDSPNNRNVKDQPENTLQVLMENDYFEVSKVEVNGEMTLASDVLSPYLLVTVIDGKGGTVHVDDSKITYDVQKGAAFVVPHGVSTVHLNGEMTLIVSRPMNHD